MGIGLSITPAFAPPQCGYTLIGIIAVSYFIFRKVKIEIQLLNLLESDESSDRSLMVDPLSYWSFQSVLHDWCTKCYQ